LVSQDLDLGRDCFKELQFFFNVNFTLSFGSNLIRRGVGNLFVDLPLLPLQL